ncbi:MAG: rRNA maturation RNase YbeY [Bacteroidia bacterium]
METEIQFFSEEIDFQLEKEDLVADWVLSVVLVHGKKCGEITYIFCSDSYLLEMNNEHLDHDYYTDILTFPYSAPEDDILISDIYISIDRVKENANSLNSAFIDELHRVMIHGILHLLGYDDHETDDITSMREAENKALALRKFVD